LSCLIHTCPTLPGPHRGVPERYRTGWNPFACRLSHLRRQEDGMSHTIATEQKIPGGPGPLSKVAHLVCHPTLRAPVVAAAPAPALGSADHYWSTGCSAVLSTLGLLPGAAGCGTRADHPIYGRMAVPRGQEPAALPHLLLLNAAWSWRLWKNGGSSGGKVVRSRTVTTHLPNPSHRFPERGVCHACFPGMHVTLPPPLYLHCVRRASPCALDDHTLV